MAKDNICFGDEEITLEDVQKSFKSIGFPLTENQKSKIIEVCKNMASSFLMRLSQSDVLNMIVNASLPQKERG